jgi:hypothetical protein
MLLETMHFPLRQSEFSALTAIMRVLDQPIQVQ